MFKVSEIVRYLYRIIATTIVCDNSFITSNSENIHRVGCISCDKLSAVLKCMQVNIGQKNKVQRLHACSIEQLYRLNDSYFFFFLENV